MVQTMYFISEAAKEVKVENHVLRYWEEELQLPIKRNELGHRYYTEEDRELFLKVKQLKENGVQLKGIRTMLNINEERGEETTLVGNSPIRINIAGVSCAERHCIFMRTNNMNNIFFILYPHYIILQLFTQYLFKNNFINSSCF